MQELPRSPPPHFSRTQFRVRLILAVIVLNLMVAALAFESLSQGLEQAHTRAAVTTQNIARLVDKDIAATLERIDLSLLALVDDLQDRPRPDGSLRDLRLSARHHFSRQPALENLLVVDAEGRIIASGRPYNGQPPPLTDRDYFRRHQQDPAAGLLHSPALQSRLTGEWVITLSRRVTHADGSFAGIVVGAVQLHHLRELFASIDLGPQGAISLRGLDLGLISRYPEAGTATLGSRQVSAELAAALRKAPDAGTYRAPTRLDGIARTNTYLRMSRYPYYVLVGLADDDYLAGWHRELLKTCVLGLVFLLATLVMTGLILHAWSRRETALDAIASTEREFRTLLDTAPDAMVIVDDGGRISRVNQRTLSLFGYLHDALIGQPASLLFAVEGASPGALEHAGSDIDLLAVGADGHHFPVSASMTSTETEGGRVLTLVIRDIAERREREEALKLAALVYQAVGEAIVVADTENRIVAVNPAFTRLTGYSAAEIIGQTTALLHAGCNNRAFFRTMEEKLAATGTWKGEILNRRKSGEVVADWLMINTIHAADGQLQWRVGMYSTVTPQKRAEESLWRQASFDVLTQLPNRRLLLDRLQQDMHGARRKGTEVALLLIDLDHFKEVNDRLGHLAGDQVLVEVSARLQACIREVDTAARLGGDEFALILGDVTERAGVRTLGDALLRALCAPYRLKEGQASISASIGIAFYPADAEDVESLFERADQAMYGAKQGGRNGLRFFSETGTAALLAPD